VEKKALDHLKNDVAPIHRRRRTTMKRNRWLKGLRQCVPSNKTFLF
jgi:hypothetical protein